jgi:hypothetical protein
MSGGIGGTAWEVSAVFVEVLAAGSVAAYENAAAAVELERLIRQEKSRHRQAVSAYQERSRIAYEAYRKNLTNCEHSILINNENETLTNWEGRRPAARLRCSRPEELYRQIVQTAEPLVTESWSGQEAARKLTEEAGRILSGENPGVGEEEKKRELEGIIRKLASLSAAGRSELRRQESLKKEYLTWTAKAGVLNRAMGRNVILCRPFRIQTAEEDIRRLQKQCEELTRALEERFRNGPETGDPAKTRRRLASRIHRAAESEGLTFLGRSECGAVESSYYTFRRSAVKCTVTDAGRVAFDCIGLPGRTKEEVVADMEQFCQFYRERLTPAMEKEGVKIRVFLDTAPGEEIVRFLEEGEIENRETEEKPRRIFRPEALRERAIEGVDER